MSLVHGHVMQQKTKTHERERERNKIICIRITVLGLTSTTTYTNHVVFFIMPEGMLVGDTRPNNKAIDIFYVHDVCG